MESTDCAFLCRKKQYAGEWGVFPGCPSNMACLMVFPADDSISKTRHHRVFWGKPETSLGLNNDRFFLLQSDHVSSVRILRSESHCGSFPILRPEFLSKGEVNVPRSSEHPGLVLTGSCSVARLPTWKQGLQMPSWSMLNLINFLSFPPNFLVQYVGIVLLKLSKSAIPDCISSPLPLAVTSVAS